MDLSFLIPSKIRRQVLAYFVANTDANISIRQIARELSTSPQQAFRELINLENWGFLFSSKVGNQRAFRLNKRFVFFPAIRDLMNQVEIEKNRTVRVIKTIKMEDYVKEIAKIPIPPELIPGLTSKRKKPRSYEEEKLLSKKGLPTS